MTFLFLVGRGTSPVRPSMSRISRAVILDGDIIEIYVGLYLTDLLQRSRVMEGLRSFVVTCGSRAQLKVLARSPFV